MSLGVRILVVAVAQLFVLLAALSVRADEYAVDGFVLGARVDTAIPNYRTYDCAPDETLKGDEALKNTVFCSRVKEAKGSKGPITVTSKLLHDRDGSLLHAMLNAAPVDIDEATVRKEIETLSGVIGSQPSEIVWLPEGSATPTAVIVAWGGLRLDAIDEQEVEPLEDVADYNDVGLTAPLFRARGGAGYWYAADFELPGKGRRHYVAVNPDEVVVRVFRPDMVEVVEQDRLLGPDDYELWWELAIAVRPLARETSTETANRIVDEVFGGDEQEKLYSRVWSIIPAGTIERLAEGKYWRHDVYGPNTGYPEVRSAAQAFIRDWPDDRFVGLAHFILGDFDAALKSDLKVARIAIEYGVGFRVIENVARELVASLPDNTIEGYPPSDPDGTESDNNFVEETISFVNNYPEALGGKSLDALVANFSPRATEARGHFDKVVQDRSSPLADDAAYMIGWLEMQRGNVQDATIYFNKVLAIANEVDPDEYDNSAGDYWRAALRQLAVVMRDMSPAERATALANNQFYNKEAVLWYTTARSAYWNFDYPLTISVAERALEAIGVPIDQLPVTTDPTRIEDAILGMDRRFLDIHVLELAYLREAAREMRDFEKLMADVGQEDPDAIRTATRAVISKYSLLLDTYDEEDGAPSVSMHKDLRQARHLIDMALSAIPAEAVHSSVREWLHYRRVRIEAAYNPEIVAEMVARMRDEYPTSSFMDDAMAEQIFAEAYSMEDVDGGRVTLDRLQADFPNGNALDNGYTWLALGLYDAQREDEAKAVDLEIIRRFPLTRHAVYAAERLSGTDQ